LIVATGPCHDLHMSLPSDLLAVETAIQAEAHTISQDLDLVVKLATIGTPTLVGASALGVMVNRDIDYTTVVSTLASASQAVACLGAELASHGMVRMVQIRDDTGSWNTDPDYPDGLYLGVQARSAAGNDWTIDLWFVDQPERQPDLDHVCRFGPAMTTQNRATVLAIKHSREADPAKFGAASSLDIYRAVLDADVRTVEDFLAWQIR